MRSDLFSSSKAAFANKSRNEKCLRVNIKLQNELCDNTQKQSRLLLSFDSWPLAASTLNWLNFKMLLKVKPFLRPILVGKWRNCGLGLSNVEDWERQPCYSVLSPLTLYILTIFLLSVATLWCCDSRCLEITVYRITQLVCVAMSSWSPNHRFIIL